MTEGNVVIAVEGGHGGGNGGSSSAPPKDQRRIDLEKWLPVTANRKAKWYYSAFHNVAAMVGAGVLGLPFAMSQLGWAPGITALVMSWAVTLYTLWQMAELHEDVSGKRFDRYYELGQHVFGPRLGFWIVAPQQAVVQMASDIVYVVTGGKSLKKFFDIVAPEIGSMRKTYFMLIFVCLQMLLSQTPNFNSLKAVSFLAALMSFSYSSVACIASVMKGRHPGSHFGVRSTTTTDITFDVFNALGTIAFAYAGHSVALEIQATMPSTKEKPSKIPMWRGDVAAYIIVALCYFSVALSGYWSFGNLVEDDVLISLEKPPWLIAMANMFVFIHVIGSYQVFAMPMFDMIEHLLVKKMKLPPGFLLRVIARSSYVAFTGFIGMCVPFFGGLLGFFGGLVFAPTTFFVPCIMWLILRKPKPFSLHWILSWFSITVGSILMILSPIGGLRQIIHDARTYKFFS